MGRYSGMVYPAAGGQYTYVCSPIVIEISKEAVMSNDQPALSPKERRKARRKAAGLVDAQDKPGYDPTGEAKPAKAEKAPSKTSRKK